MIFPATILISLLFAGSATAIRTHDKASSSITSLAVGTVGDNMPPSAPAPATGTRSLRQTTRKQILARMKRPARRSQASAAPTAAPGSVTVEGTFIFNYFGDAPGNTLNPVNPGNTNADYPAYTNDLDTGLTFDDALTQCAELTYEGDDTYYGFSMYFLISEDHYVCTSQYDGMGDINYVNVADADVGQSYLYSA